MIPALVEQGDYKRVFIVGAEGWDHKIPNQEMLKMSYEEGSKGENI